MESFIHQVNILPIHAIIALFFFVAALVSVVLMMIKQEFQVFISCVGIFLFFYGLVVLIKIFEGM